MPEALTTWKLMAFAHDKTWPAVTWKNDTNTKPLMVQPNAPRFVRQGDRINWPVKVVNLTDKEINGTLQLELLDASTLALLMDGSKHFSCSAPEPGSRTKPQPAIPH